MPQLMGTATGALYDAARLCAFAALALLVGLAFFVAAWWPAAGRRPAMRRLIWSSWSMLVVTTIALFLLFGPQATDRPLAAAVDSALLSASLQSRAGMATLARLLLLSLAAPALALMLVRTAAPTAWQRRRRAGLVLGGAAVLAATWSVAGHSAVGRHSAIAVGVDVVHLVAMGVWLGGLVALCAVLLRDPDVAAMRSAVPSFSRAVPICVGLLVVTGLYQTWRQVGSPAALTTTSYGRLLLGKVLLVVVLIGLGAASRSWVRRHYHRAGQPAAPRRRARRGPAKPELARFRRLVAAEAGIAVVVLGVTAALVASPPARIAQIETAAAGAQRPGQGDAGEAGGGQGGGAVLPAPVPAQPVLTPATARVGFDAVGPVGAGVVDLAVLPATVGSNELHLTVLGASGRLLDVPGVSAVMTLPDRAPGPLPIALRRLAPGHFAGSVRIPATGRWQLTVSLWTSDVHRTTITTPVEIG